MSHLTPKRNGFTQQFEKNIMDTDKETIEKEVTVIQENNACREDIEGLPYRREQEK